MSWFAPRLLLYKCPCLLHCIDPDESLITDWPSIPICGKVIKRQEVPFFQSSSDRRMPNYLKNITPDDQYRLLEMARIGGFVRRQKGMGRPTKKEGREMKEFADEAFFGFDDWDDENPLWTEEDEEALQKKDKE